VILHDIDLERITGVSRVKIRVSIGITVCPFHGSDALTLAEGAREKMLRARAMGGNRIIAKN
jgi:GGDEF domain-containing protein